MISQGTWMFQQFEIACKKGLELELLDTGVLAMAVAMSLISLGSPVTTALCCAWCSALEWGHYKPKGP